VTSTNPIRNNAFGNTFDGTEVSKTLNLSNESLDITSELRANTSIEANVGSVEKIPAALINLY
jgi:hypothetical protein